MKGRPVIPARLCAICVRGEATTTTRIDGRVYQVCAEHGDGTEAAIPDGPRDALGRKSRVAGLRTAVLRVLARTPDLTGEILGDACGVEASRGHRDRRARNAFRHLLGRMVAEGYLQRNGELFRLAATRPEAPAPVCACGAAIVASGERGPRPTMCRVCRRASDDQKRRDANRRAA